MKRDGRWLSRPPKVIQDEPPPSGLHVPRLNEVPDLRAPHRQMATVDLPHGARANDQDPHPGEVLRRRAGCKRPRRLFDSS